MPFLISAPPPKKNPGSVPVQPCIFPKARANEQTTEKRPIGDICFIKLKFGYFGCDDQEKIQCTVHLEKNLSDRRAPTTWTN